MRSFQYAVALLVTLAWTASSLAQVELLLDEDNFLVLSGNGERASGLDLISASGGLIPAADGQAAPFMFLLNNTPNQITYGNLGTEVIIEGELRLTAGWDPQATARDLEAAYGMGALPIEIPILDSFYDGGGAAVGVSLNENHRFVLGGSGLQLSSLAFHSASGSLVPAETPAPFSSTPVNTPRQVSYDSLGTNVTIDGEVTLSSGWDPSQFRRDVEWEYVGDTRSVERTALPERLFNLPSFGNLVARVDDDNFVVIIGSGHPLTQLSLESNNGTLLPGDDPAPFDSISVSTANLVTFQPLGESVVLDGEVTLSTQWDSTTRIKDIVVDYDLQGDLQDRRVHIPSSLYPELPPPPPVIPEGIEPILITLDADNNFVLTGVGQELVGIDIKSPSGSLTMGETAAPFPFLLSATNRQTTLGTLGTVAIFGSVTLDFGVTSPEAFEELDIAVGYPDAFQLDHSPGVFLGCIACELPTITVSDDRALLVSNFGEDVTAFKLVSTESVLAAFEVPPELTVVSRNDMEILIVSEDGFDAELLNGLVAAWGEAFDGQVFVSYTLASGQSFGPLPLTLSAVPEPSSCLLMACAAWGFVFRRRRSTTS